MELNLLPTKILDNGQTLIEIEPNIWVDYNTLIMASTPNFMDDSAVTPNSSEVIVDATTDTSTQQATKK